MLSNTAPNIGATSGAAIMMMPIKANICAALRPS